MRADLTRANSNTQQSEKDSGKKTVDRRPCSTAWLYHKGAVERFYTPTAVN